MNSFVEIIDAFGGASSFGRAIGVPESHARAMRTRKSIPDGYWMRTVKAAQEHDVQGVTLESLAELAESDLANRLRMKEAT